MRIRKRTPARAASPGLSPAFSAPPPPPQLPQQRPKETLPHEEEEDEAEEKRVILVPGTGDREVDRVPDASEVSALDDVPQPESQDGGGGARCSRNDGKRWRCKNAAAPGNLFCDRHAKWSTSTRKRKPRVTRKKKKKNQGGDVVEPVAEEAQVVDKDVRDEDPATAPRQLGPDDDDGGGLYYYGGFQAGSRKLARGGGPGPAF